uniref:protein MIX23 isoform X1 n=1 Tax=Myxine glutinosa TaxID=7769 RepID=UPI00358E2457
MAAPSEACGDWAAFMEMLNRLRTTDDRIVHELNVSVPTASISALVDPTTTCKQLYMKLQEAHQTRAAAIRACVTLSSKHINELNDQRVGDYDDLTLRKELRNEQLKLKMFQSELNVEEVVNDRTWKVFNERCRLYFKPPK